MANTDSSTVAGNRAKNSPSTGLRVTIELPRSPWSRLPRKPRYCSTSGRSKPYWAIIWAWRSGVMPRSPTISRTGSPGTRRIRMKATKVTPRKVGIRTASRAPRKRNMSVAPPTCRARRTQHLDRSSRGLLEPRVGLVLMADQPNPSLCAPPEGRQKAGPADCRRARVGPEIVLRGGLSRWSGAPRHSGRAQVPSVGMPAMSSTGSQRSAVPSDPSKAAKLGWNPSSPLAAAAPGIGATPARSMAGSAAHCDSSPLQGSGSGSASLVRLGDVVCQPVAGHRLRSCHGRGGVGHEVGDRPDPLPQIDAGIVVGMAGIAVDLWPAPRRRG